MTEATPETLTVPVATVTVPLTTADTDAPATCEIVPEITTVFEILTVPLTAAEMVCVGASQTNCPVTAACVVVFIIPDAVTVPLTTAETDAPCWMVTDTPLLTVTVPLTAAETVCVGASQTTAPVTAA